ncbi:MAG: extracellular solute-binding protein [Anaerolineales bacterium]|nr:extracellular solute-binding protein [Anaerolineales bacterium]
MKHRMMLSVLALGLAAAAVACATATPAPTQPPAATVDPAACHLTPPAEPVTVNVLGWSFDIMDFYADEFKKCGEIQNVDVSVKLLDNTGVYEAVRLALSSGGTSPYDIVHGANTSMIEWGSQGWLLPLNDLVEKYRAQYNLDDISAKAWEGSTIDGKIYGVPVVGNTLHLAYRADLFEKYGVKVPTTYDEVIQACQVLKAEPGLQAPFAMDVSAGWAWELEFFHFIRSYGSDFLNADNTPAFNSPEGVAAATKMKEVVDACMGEAHITLGYEANEVAMRTGTLAFTEIWSANTNSMIDPAQSQFASVIKFAPAPAPQPGGLLGGSAWNDYYSIPTTTAVDPDLLFRLIMEVADVPSMQAAAKVGIVTRTSIKDGLPTLLASSETMAKGVGIYPPNPAIPLARAALGNWLPYIGTGEKTPQEALDAAAEEYIKEAKAQGFLK